MEALGAGVSVLAVAGLLYTAMSGVFVLRFFRGPSSAPTPTHEHRRSVSVTVMKPLHGDELGLRQNLQSFFIQTGLGPVEILFGVQDAADPALKVIKSLIAEHPIGAAKLCLDEREHGYNRKVSNLINMASLASGEVFVLSDSDISAPADYLSRVLHALVQPGVGVVTCPYYGKGEAGFWSQIAAMGLSYQFLPNVVTGVALGMARPCMGSTIALRRETLERIGGFERFRNVLADDYAIGAAVRLLGLKSVTAPVLVSHSCTEKALTALFLHELRWARTVKGVDPAGHAGSIVTHPLPLALLALLLLGPEPFSILLLAAAFLARIWLMSIVDQASGQRLGAWWIIPIRDMLSFVVFVGSFFSQAVEWRGAKFHVTTDGDLSPL